MASKLERTLLRDETSHGDIRKTLSKYLDDGASLYCLRVASRNLRDHVELLPNHLWGTLYLHAPPRSSDKILTLERISRSCHTLAIKVRIPDRTAESQPKYKALMRGLLKGTVHVPPTTTSTGDILWPQDLGAYELDRQLWAHIFKSFKNLQALTLRVDSDPGWPGRGEVEHTLTTLRCALERAELSRLRSLFLSPVHICGILHLHWHGFGALYEVAPYRTCRNLWQSISLLNIHLSSATYTNLLTEAQTIMSIKVLQNYLRSFAPTLRCFLFVWMDGEGPSPLLLDDEPGMERIPQISWPRLEVLYFGHISSPNKTIQALSDRAPNVTLVKVLRSTHRISGMEAEDDEAWVEVGGENSMDRRRRVANSAASSFYSQDGM